MFVFQPFIFFRMRYCILLFLLLTSLETLKAQSAREITEKMLASIAQTKTLTYSSVITERINGKLQVAENKVKLHISPFKAYVYLVKPKTGVEVLYVAGKNENKALIKPNKFPFVNVSLDLQSSILRNEQHHTITELGFSYFGEIIIHDMHKNGSTFDSRIACKGSKKWETYDCFVITLENPDFAYINYTVKPHENLITIARKLKISEFMILENNHGISDYYDVKPGQVIKIPNYYGQKTILYVDKKTYLPVLKAIFDDKGLFEKYEYKNLMKNSVIHDEEFTATYKGYGF